MRNYFPIYEEAVSQIWLCNCSILNFLIYEENVIFFFISVSEVVSYFHLARQSPDLHLTRLGLPPPLCHYIYFLFRNNWIYFCVNLSGWFVPLLPPERVTATDKEKDNIPVPDRILKTKWVNEGHLPSLRYC